MNSTQIHEQDEDLSFPTLRAGKNTRIRFVVSYDGTDYCGWQRQKHGPLKSVAHVIEDVLRKFLNEPDLVLFASGRTDAGVHALNQVCHFDTVKPAEFFQSFDFPWAFRNKLPNSITIKQAWIAPPDFHATISATHKTYRYLILNTPRPSAMLTRYMDWVRKPIEIEHLQASSKLVLGKQDFKSFQSVGTVVPHTVREIYQADWVWRKPHVLQFTITGSGFLKQMVRNIVGTQLFLEKKGESPDKMAEIIQARDRKIAGPPAVPQGLYLMRVFYPSDLDNRCLKL